MTQRDDRFHSEYLAGIFFISAASLLLEVCLTRLLAVTLWYHFAFMIISGGLLGFGAAAVVVSMSRWLRESPMAPTLAGLSVISAVLAIGCFSLTQAIPLQPFSMTEDAMQIFYMALTYLLLTLPFFLIGLVVSLLLSRLVESVTTLYALDLAGAGVGSIAALLLMSYAGGPRALVLSAALAAAAAASFAWRLGVKARVAGVGVCFLLMILSLTADDWLPLNISSNKGLGRATSMLESGRSEITRWSAIGRVDVIRARSGEPRILIDGGAAATRVPVIRGSVDDWTPPPEGMREAMALAGEDPLVVVIGSGGGYEVASALALGAAKVYAVEMNEAIVDVVTNELDGETKGLFRDPRVELHVDEGRSFVRRGEHRVDLIASVHTISNAAWASGALSLAENYTLTVEAIDDFLERLTPEGVLWLTRPEAQLPRLVSTVRAAFERRGVEDIERHVIAYRRPGRGRSFLGGLIVSKRAIGAADAAGIVRLFSQDRLQPLLLPGQAPRGEDAAAFRAALAGEPFPDFTRRLGDLRPCTDEQPYFNQRVPWLELRPSDVLYVVSRGQQGRMALEEAPVAEVAVLIVLAWAVLFSLVLMIVPFLHWRRADEAKSVPLGLIARLILYFIALGLGYITVEICLIQRFGLFVGRPEYALAVVLASMLVGSGGGSMLATRWAATPRRVLPLVFGGALLLIGAHALFGPAIARSLLGLSIVWRMLVAGLFVLPVGFLLGMPLPLGLRTVPEGSTRLASWLFGLNCASSVIGSSICVILSSSLGFMGTLLAAGGVYGLAALVIVYDSRRSP